MRIVVPALAVVIASSGCAKTAMHTAANTSGSASNVTAQPHLSNDARRSTSHLQPAQNPALVAGPEATPKADEPYREVSDRDLKCRVRVREITYAFDSAPDGKLIGFECVDQGGKTVKIPLAKKTMTKGEIVTASLGTVRMKMVGSGVSGITYFTGKQMWKAVRSEGIAVSSAAYYMTDSQVRAFKVKLGWNPEDLEIVDAAYSGDYARIQAAVTRGAHVNARGSDGSTALMYMADSGNTEGVKFLLAHGANVNAKDDAGQTALFKANGRELDAVRALIAAGADLNVRDNGGDTPVMEYARLCDAKYVTALVVAGANTARTGLTPLMLAAAAGDAERVRAALKTSEGINARSGGGQTPLFWAAASGQPECVQALLAAGAKSKLKANDGSTALTEAALAANPDCVKALISAGSEVNAAEKDGATALILACRIGNLESVRLLIAGGAKVNAKDNAGSSAFASASGNPEIISVLKAAGATN